MTSIKIQGLMKGYFSQVKGAEGGGGIGKEEVIYWLFFFFAGSFLKQVDRSQMRQVLAQKSSNIDNRISTGVDDYLKST